MSKADNFDTDEARRDRGFVDFLLSTLAEERAKARAKDNEGDATDQEQTPEQTDSAE